MAVVEVSVAPIGTNTASISDHVARCIDVLDESGLKYRVCPMGTVIEGELGDVLATVAKMHQVPFESGAQRVLTHVAVDDRRDKPLTMDGKLAAVRARRTR